LDPLISAYTHFVGIHSYSFPEYFQKASFDIHIGKTGPIERERGEGGIGGGRERKTERENERQKDRGRDYFTISGTVAAGSSMGVTRLYIHHRYLQSTQYNLHIIIVYYLQIENH